VTAELLLPGHAAPTLITDSPWPATHPRPRSRRVFSAAHVAAGASGTIDWDATLGFRDHLWSHGFGVAEAMDTAQRGMGLKWPEARELIERACARAAGPGGLIACGAGTDQLDEGAPHSLAAIVNAYKEQVEVVQSAGGQVILMASRALAAAARSSSDYVDVYARLLDDLKQPAIVHWLGESFDPALRGYWGSDEFGSAARTVLELVQRAGDKIDGVKLSVLDATSELALRRQLPAGIRMYTGDDYHFADLIRGNSDGYSDALLGIFAAIAAPAAEALQALDRGDGDRYLEILVPTEELSRKLFEAPTFHYKTGIAFLAWLNGLQPEFRMLDHFEKRRSLRHLIAVFELAAQARVLLQPALAAERMSALIASRTDER
jgi:hypothetical protein